MNEKGFGSAVLCVMGGVLIGWIAFGITIPVEEIPKEIRFLISILGVMCIGIGECLILKKDDTP